MEYALFGGLVLVSLVGIALAVFQLPGTWLILAAAIGYDGYFGWTQITWPWLVGMAVFAVVVEVFDTLAGAVAAKRAGASRRAVVGSLVGGFAGMFIFSIPVPVLGTIVGGLLGCFAGALAGELSVKQDLVSGARVGLFATLGKIVGLVAKTSAALVLAGAAVSRAAWAMVN